MMHRRTRIPLLLAVLALVASACGKGSTSETSAVEVLAAALTDTAAATSYRLESSTAQNLSSSALGIDSSAEIDPDNPGTVAEVTPEGTHIRLDLSALLGPLAGDLDELAIEIWASSDQVVTDTTSYAVFAQINPSFDLGPYRPGVFSIDLTRVADLAEGRIVEALGGQSVDLATMGADLPTILRSVQRSESNPNVYRGTATFADLTRAQGGDVEALAAGAAAGVGLSAGLDAGILADLYLEFYEGLETDVVVTLDSDGLLESLSIVADMSGIFDVIFSSREFRQSLGASDAEMAAQSDAFADTEWVMETLIRFTSAPNLVLEPAPTVTEDRTDEFLAFMRDSGVFDD
jgi:hypothetical protein